MRDFRDAKVVAHTLRHALKGRAIEISHSESLELIAKALRQDRSGRAPEGSACARPDRRTGARSTAAAALLLLQDASRCGRAMTRRMTISWPCEASGICRACRAGSSSRSNNQRKTSSGAERRYCPSPRPRSPSAASKPADRLQTLIKNVERRSAKSWVAAASPTDTFSRPRHHGAAAKQSRPPLSTGAPRDEN